MVVKNLEFKGKPGGEPRNNPKRENLIRLKGKKRREEMKGENLGSRKCMNKTLL